MYRIWWPTLFVSAMLCTAAQAFDASQWKIAFEDHFDRSEVGPDWIMSGKAEIVDGRLKYGLDGQHLAVINRHFAADVRIEFDAEAAPGVPPCDLSVGLGCGEGESGYSNGYLLAFGGNFNTMNQIQGGRDMKWVLNWYPPRLIQKGKAHRVCGMKEGKTLTLEVDGEVLVTTTDNDPLGGPGYDMVGTVTWNGMLVDNVRVYERKTKHPDTPRYVTGLKGLPFELDDNRKLHAARAADDPTVRKGVDLFNAGRPHEAEQVFLSVSDPEMRAAGAAFAAGHLYYDGSIDDYQRVGRMLRDLAAARPNDERLQDYGELGLRFQAFSVLRIGGLPNGELAVGTAMAMGRANNPFYDKARYYNARLMRAHLMEGGDYKAQKAVAIFAELKKWYPEHPGLRELTGEQLAWGQELADDASDAPAWARYLRELYARQCAVLNWWFTKRQYKDGQLGGGWGDDCEILRAWGPLAVISNGDPAIVDGIERLCMGIWRGAINPEYGFSGYGDVEHSSEPSTDTQPTMMILRWGDPLFIERNMRSAKTIRDIYMGVDQTGHYRFRSAFYGEGLVGKTPGQEGDVHYNTRTMKHLQQLAFWGNKEARRVYLSWLDGWRQQTMTAYPNKPAGVVPGQLYWPTGTVIPPAGTTPKDWVSTNAPDPDAVPGMGGMIMGGFLAGYRFTGDPKFLEPMYNYCMNTSTGPLVLNDKSLKPGSREWVLCGQQGDTHTDTVASFRWLSGDRTVDEYLMRFASPYQRYMVTNDPDALIKDVEKAAKAMRVNFRLMTEELLQTDRAGLPMSRESSGAYTGALHNWCDGLTPTMAVTWDVPDTNFAALVVAGSQQRLRTWVYSFHDQPVRMGMRLWRLTPGRYAAAHGGIMKGESTNLRYRWSPTEEFTYRRRLDTYYVEVPPRKPYCIDLRLIEPIAVPQTAPDPAIAARDVILDSDGRVKVTAHNVGSEPINGLAVALDAGDGKDHWQRVAVQPIANMPAPELDPVTQTVSFDEVPTAKAYRVILDPDQQIEELYEGNNIAIVFTELK
jgi:hypothetical protein